MYAQPCKSSLYRTVLYIMVGFGTSINYGISEYAEHEVYNTNISGSNPIDIETIFLFILHPKNLYIYRNN